MQQKPPFAFILAYLFQNVSNQNFPLKCGPVSCQHLCPPNKMQKKAQREREREREKTKLLILRNIVNRQTDRQTNKH